MANLYVGADGVIHSGTGNGVAGAVSVNSRNSNSQRTSGYNYSGLSNNYIGTSYVSTGRKIAFWVFSIFASILIGIGLYQLVGSALFAQYDAETATETVENWFWSLAPWLFVICSCIGSIGYGVLYAETHNYNLGAFVLSALSAIGGIIVGAIALAIVCFVVVLIMYIMGFLFALLIIGAIIAGLCNT